MKLIRNEWTVEHIVRILEGEIRAEGSQRNFCKKFGLREAHVSMVLNGKENPQGKLLEVLGFERVVIYRFVNE